MEERTGPVRCAEPVATGAVSELVAVLHTATGAHFCKGIRSSNPLAWMHRNEARLNPYLPGVAPRLRWVVERGGWLLLGFERVAGRHPDLAPGSADLARVAGVLSGLASAPAPAVDVRPAAVRWAGWVDPEVVDGDTLAHTDVTARNFLVHAAGVAVVDWSAPCRGAAWIDTALMVVRLVRAGHSPERAEAWTGSVSAWASAPAGALDAFAVARAGLLRERHRGSGAPHLGELADAAEAWMWHRLPL
ncbi:hypothetical protein [Pseudosporangium ferrugineum]|uniref:hypothetical protein n=1 Tax=Pseudosporangium ferrugineum TaxID=439699 RepID=UPI001304F9C6|nr:hypothetical protein [Pseudosporangium ferrugineum]